MLGMAALNPFVGSCFTTLCHSIATLCHSIVFYCVVLYCTSLYCRAYCIVLYCTVLYCCSVSLRECLRDHPGSVGCRSMCCGRGFTTVSVELSHRCECKYY